MENFWETPIKSKWAKAYIAGPNLLNEDINPYALLMRLDEALEGSSSFFGNDSDFESLINKWCGKPKRCPDKIYYKNRLINTYPNEEDIKKTYNLESGKSVSKYLDDINKIRNTYLLDYYEEVKKYNYRYRHIGKYGDMSILSVYLFSSPYLGGPTSWFNVRTGDVGGLSTFGKYPKTVGAIKEELLWFIREFPRVELFISIREDNDDEIINLHLYNGEIEKIGSFDFNVKKLEKINHSKGSKNAIYHNWLFKVFLNILPKNVIKQSWAFNHSIDEQYFTWKETFEILSWWKDELHKYWKNHNFLKEFEEAYIDEH